MDGRIGVLELPGSWCLPRLAELSNLRQQHEAGSAGASGSLQALSAANAPHPLPDLIRRLPPPTPPRNFGLGPSLVQIAQAAPAAQTNAPFTTPTNAVSQPLEPDQEEAQREAFSDWDSDSGDEVLTQKELEKCHMRFEKEDAQVERNASRFAAIRPAFGHKVLPQHARTLNQMQEI